jgi:hypothetical protein
VASIATHVASIATHMAISGSENGIQYWSFLRHLAVSFGKPSGIHHMRCSSFMRDEPWLVHKSSGSSRSSGQISLLVWSYRGCLTEHVGVSVIGILLFTSGQFKLVSAMHSTPSRNNQAGSIYTLTYHNHKDWWWLLSPGKEGHDTEIAPKGFKTRNLLTWPFIGKLLRSTFSWYYLFFDSNKMHFLSFSKKTQSLKELRQSWGQKLAGLILSNKHSL